MVQVGTETLSSVVPRMLERLRERNVLLFPLGELEMGDDHGLGLVENELDVRLLRNYGLDRSTGE